MLVEFNFIKKEEVNADEVHKWLEQELEKRKFPLQYVIVSVTSMSKWLVVLVDFPMIKKENRLVHFAFDMLAGLLVLKYNVRYRHWEVHGRNHSLIYHKDWTKPRVALIAGARDEGKYVKEWIEKLKPYFDDVIIAIDDRTEDNTADEIVAGGGRWIFHQWNDNFSDLFNKAANSTDCYWVFKLDIDEEPTQELLDNLRELCIDDRYWAYKFIIKNLVHNTTLTQVRLYRQNKGRWRGRVHNIVRYITGDRDIPKDKVKKTNYSIKHYQRWATMGKDIAKKRVDEYKRLAKLQKEDEKRSA
jgi:hypothetical protein